MVRVARRGRATLLLGLLAVAAVLVPGVYAVQIQLISENVARVGGTGGVQILTPTQSIDSVTFTLDSYPPYHISGVTVTFTPEETGTYTIAVNIYDTIGNILGSGIVTGIQAQTDPNTGNLLPITQDIPITPTVDPAQAEAVEVIVLQETTK